jgi:hypothetical protein
VDDVLAHKQSMNGLARTTIAKNPATVRAFAKWLVAAAGRYARRRWLR